jgi:ribosomal protein S27E
MKKTVKKIPPAGYKILQCKYCGNDVDRVDSRSTAVTCYRCVNRMVDGEILELRYDDSNK